METLVVQDYKCALTGAPLVVGENASVDRIDSSRGYELGNIQWVTKEVNRMKIDFDQKLFIELCRKVAEYND